jgi:dCTP deaminase
MMPSQVINWLIATRQVRSVVPIEPSQIQPASIDLRLGHKAHRVRASFLPGGKSRVHQRLKDLSLHEIDLSEGAVLEAGSVYVAEVQESLELRPKISAVGNPKSSTGRIDVFTRLIVDYAEEFDRIPDAYSGRLFVEISPRTFPVLVRAGSRLTQLRFRRGTAVSSSADTLKLHQTHPLVTGVARVSEGAVALSIDLSPPVETGVIGFRAKRHSGLIDVDRPNCYRPDDFWEPMRGNAARNLILDPDEFYILVTKEAISVPPTHAAELMPYNPLVGEFRVHYAGFFDPGFGFCEERHAPSRGVLEVRSHEVPFVLEDGQFVGRLVYERLMDAPFSLYGQTIGSSYQGQALSLSKHFKAWDPVPAI